MIRTTADGALTPHYFTAEELGCASGGTCSQSTLFVSGGLNYYWIRGSNASGGAGPWSWRQAFVAEGPSVPSRPTLSFPTGDSVYVDKPTYQWTPSSSGTPATDFSLAVTQNGSVLVAQTYTAAAAGCEAPGALCQVMPDVVIPEGMTEWQVKAANDYGESPWTQSSWYSHPAVIPPLPTYPIGISPTGVINTNSPTYEWYGSPHASQYHLIIRDSNQNVLSDTSYTSLQAHCGVVRTFEKCSATPPLALGSRSYEFLVAFENSAGAQDSGPATTFTVGVVRATLLSPTESAESVPTYQWDAVSGATSYRLRIRSNGVYLPDAIVTAAAAGCDGGSVCSYIEGTSLALGSYNVWWVDTDVPNHAWSRSLNFAVPPPT